MLYALFAAKTWGPPVQFYWSDVRIYKLENHKRNKYVWGDNELFQLYSVVTHGTPDLVLVLFFSWKSPEAVSGNFWIRDFRMSIKEAAAPK